MEPSTTPAETLTAAVLKAATVVKSCADSILSGGDCINDPRPASGGEADAVIGIIPEKDPPGACATEKGGRVEVAGGGDVVVPGENCGGAADVVVAPGKKAAAEVEDVPCVDALQGLDVGAKERNGGGGGEMEVEEGDEEEAILVEGVV